MMSEYLKRHSRGCFAEWLSINDMYTLSIEVSKVLTEARFCVARLPTLIAQDNGDTTQLFTHARKQQHIESLVRLHGDSGRGL
jgi:hypothetical protein